MATLYKLTDKAVELIELLESCIDPETGEVKDEVWLEEINKLSAKNEQDLKDKIEGIIKYIQNEKSDVEAIKKEIDRLNKISKSKTKKIDRVKDYMLFCLNKIDLTSVKTKLGSVTKSSTVKLEINESLLPKEGEFIKKEVVTSIDKNIIKKMLKDKKEVPGATLVKSEFLTIREA